MHVSEYFLQSSNSAPKSLYQQTAKTDDPAIIAAMNRNSVVTRNPAASGLVVFYELPASGVYRESFNQTFERTARKPDLRKADKPES